MHFTSSILTLGSLLSAHALPHGPSKPHISNKAIVKIQYISDRQSNYSYGAQPSIGPSQGLVRMDGAVPSVSSMAIPWPSSRPLPSYHASSSPPSMSRPHSSPLFIPSSAPLLTSAMPSPWAPEPTPIEPTSPSSSAPIPTAEPPKDDPTDFGNYGNYGNYGRYEQYSSYGSYRKRDGESKHRQ